MGDHPDLTPATPPRCSRARASARRPSRPIVLCGGTNTRTVQLSRSSRYLRPSKIRRPRSSRSWNSERAVRLVVEKPVKHDFVAASGDTQTKVVNQRPVAVQRMRGPPTTIPVGNPFARAGAMKRDNSKRHGPVLSDPAVRLLQIVWRRKEARIIVADAEPHCYTQPASAN